jgi:hypothetical protein
VINGTSVLGKGNPRWPINNVAETRKVPGVGPPMLGSLAARGGAIQERPAVGVTAALRSATAGVVAWLTDLPRRWGKRLFAMNDAEAGWRGWSATVTAGGLGRQYRDPRFDALREEFEAHGGRVEPNADKET